jgi:Lon protease-like protein
VQHLFALLKTSQAVAYNRNKFCDYSSAGGALSSLLPIFPLDLVLFPGVPQPLHIFEPRYKEMIGECLANKANFGIVRAAEEGVAEIGCTAEIVAVTKEYEDGRLDIVTEGRKRFEVLEVNQERSFLRAEVLFFEDEDEKPTGDEVTQVTTLHRQILELAGAQQNLPEEHDILLSFHLAGSLPLDLDFKQNLLTVRSEAQRIRALIEYLSAILPKLRYTVQARQKAGGNGHAH